MIIHDHPELLNLIVDFLVENNFDVQNIPQYQDAFTQIKKKEPDIVVCDISSDTLIESFALIDMLYLDPKTRDIPLIVCAMATQHMQEISPSLAAKGIFWLEKPFAIEALVELIQKIERKGLA
jgi:Response regulator receiver domain.